MTRHLPIWSFLLAVVCVSLFFISTSSTPMIDAFITYFSIHPLNVVLILTIVCFFFIMISLKDVKNITSLMSSFTALLLTLILAISIVIILFSGNLLH